MSRELKAPACRQAWESRKPEIVLALDVDTYKKAKYFVNKLYPTIKIFKVGSQLFTASGPQIIKFINSKGGKVFLDLKFNDIPNTMVNAVREAVKYKVSMFTVHTLSGPTALKEVAKLCKHSKTKAIGVTILTSICQHFLKDLGIKRKLSQEVLYLAGMAKRSGLSGIVCSVEEARMIRKKFGKKLLIITPGIRPKQTKKDDQKRIATVEEAMKAGSDYLVIGRPILQARDPLLAVREILQSI
ncbi:MAG: orotidine-5'-phosphate decarboxylase [Candidatus Omnitrophica bacterium]|nr:orotidine-5'-phosphate decarboxylase [Candidatus Omnitrophota bacterium]